MAFKEPITEVDIEEAAVMLNDFLVSAGGRANKSACWAHLASQKCDPGFNTRERGLIVRASNAYRDGGDYVLKSLKATASSNSRGSGDDLLTETIHLPGNGDVISGASGVEHTHKRVVKYKIWRRKGK